MRSSPVTASIKANNPRPLMEERLEAWQPERISDRKLEELQNRLEKIRRLGDSFAAVELSPPLQARLRELTGPVSRQSMAQREPL